MNAISPLISLQRIDLILGNFSSRVHVLKSINLNIDSGEVVGLVGPSGSGKSTLLMTMAGLERPNSGAVFIQGQNITTMNEDELALFRGTHIGIVFQSFHLMPTMTALENVALPLELAGRKNSFEKAKQELISVGLAERAHHYPAQLSGGEQQRVAIARALIADPSIVIADEPTGNLDDATGQTIVDILFNLQKNRGTTLILVTHDETLAQKCNRIISLRSGEIIADQSHVDGKKHGG